MLMPASSEFVSLCRSQITIVIEGLGASLGAVYLTEELAGSAHSKLVPIVVYPEEAAPWSESILRLPANLNETQSYLPITDASVTPGHFPGVQQPEKMLFPEAGANLPQKAAPTSDASSLTKVDAPLSLPGQQRIVLPLIHEGIVLGLLVTSREDRQWYEWEHTQLEQVAHTLAIARVLDQRQQWSAHSDQHRRLLQTQQQDTLADLLHQFRNPLTTLRTLGKLLLKRLSPADANREVANSVIRESERLQDLLQQFNQTVDAGQAALETPTPRLAGQDDRNETLPAAPRLLPPSRGIAEVELPLQPCFIAQVLDPLIRSALAIAAERDLALQADIPSLPPVQANPQALREVLSNLIDNALKYTPAPGQVSIQVCRKQLEFGHYQAVAVHDTGPGIPAADLNRVLERHYRGVQAQTDVPGSGLGLAIADELVKQMQGKLQVFSPALPSSNLPDSFPGPGSTFIIWLPEVSS